MSVRLSGMDVLIMQLEGGARIEEAAKKIVKRRTSEMNRLAQRKAPVDTGELRRSITSVYTDNGMTGQVSAGMHYSPYVEYGTRFMTAQPFMRPAYQATKAEFITDLERLVR
ncbi:HK97-gp10 family putative phage morphogenesis protein [Planomicrobium okeanokoites]|uniref:HK97-gp10 family putative phage morphogenesis protein n=1 Tax=Planomicrobium okeanokoites TaxID=244 RepID=A0ABV7KT66_PLAOK|nr:HK97-gp10 family putative phage morphogenesis protein [Planomicrobium okeanokoites]TAA71595.1 hypothetical protein D2910_04775 [Planomicrobium okeanokoites]